MNTTKIPKGDLGKFLKGEPQTDQLAELMRIEDESGEQERPKVIAIGGRRLPTTDDDREHIRQMIHSPGWAVFLELLDNKVVEREDAARQASMFDPLNEENKRLWLAASSLKQARIELTEIVEREAKIAVENLRLKSRAGK